MNDQTKKVLVVGATGSIGSLAVEEAVRRGYSVRALVRERQRAAFQTEVEIMVGDVTSPSTLLAAVDNIDAIIFTLGSDGQGKRGAEHVDYQGVRNVLAALGGRTARISLMTSIGVTNRDGSYNRTTEAHDWKRRSERLVRASGLPYTIVRPGWFDCNAADQLQLTLLQGDLRRSGTPQDGVVARHQIAEVLVHSLASHAALRKTFELVAERGPAPHGADLDSLLDRLSTDMPGALDGVRDTQNMPLDAEPERVIADLHAAHRPD